MTDLGVIDAFQRELEAQGAWPPKRERKMRDDLKVYRALRESDRAVLRGCHAGGWEAERKYIVDPLAERIPGAFADLIYGEAPTFTAAATSDQDHLDEMVQANGLVDQFQEGVGISSGEGSAWWRVVADRSLVYPSIEFHSRLAVVPSFAGRQLRAVAFFEELERPPTDREDEKSVWWYVAIEGRGATRNLLFRADDRSSGLGKSMPLTSHYFTVDLPEEWNHGLDVILAGYVPNVNGGGRSGSGRTVGRSDYTGVKDLLLELNEAATIGSENMGLTAKKRVVLTPEYLDAEGNFPAGVDVLLASNTDRDPDDPTKGLVQLEWSFDAAPLVQWIEHTEEKALTRARVAPQLVGRNTESAQTGPAFRARLLDSLLAAGGKARPWDTEGPKMLEAAQLVDSLPIDRGGFGRPWAKAGEAPAVERASALPVDEREEAERVVTEVGGEVLSRRTAVEERHPEWDEVRVDKEMAQIAEFEPTAPAPFDPYAEPPANVPPEDT